MNPILNIEPTAKGRAQLAEENLVEFTCKKNAEKSISYANGARN